MTDIQKSISEKYCPRFGQIAIEMGFITEAQLKEALCIQVDEELAGKSRRLLGAILFDKDLMTGDQIERVLNAVLQKTRMEENAGKGQK
ncbi:MAG: hypothetical protein HYZ46_03215 [Nitrosomonadales bacterium]|nr:hypothetical protein [Nitrosomonadales bacterium]